MRDAMPVLVTLRDEDAGEPITLHGSFRDAQLPFERFRSINLLGTYDDYQRLVDLYGGLLPFEITTDSDQAPSYGGIGRLAGLSVAFTGHASEVVQHLGRLDVSKIIERRIVEPNEKARSCSYVLEPRISNWPSKYLFQWSYDGTITGRPMKEEMIIEAEPIIVEISRHYYYKKIEETHSVEQTWLPLITINGSTEDKQAGDRSQDLAIIQTSILLLSFMYNVNLELVSKSTYDSKGLTHVYWPPHTIETKERGYHDFAVEVEKLNDFLNIAFQNVVTEDFGLDGLNVILRRFINGTQATSLESRITYISEAIEGIIVFAGLRKSEHSSPDLGSCIDQIKEIIDSSSCIRKEAAKSKASLLFAPPAWDNLKAIVEDIYPDSEHFRDICLNRGRFFSIRNRVVHRGMTAWDSDIYLQIDIAAYLFKMLFCYVVGCPHIRPRPGHSLEYATAQQESDPPKRIFLWE